MAKVSPLMIAPPAIFLAIASLFLVGMFRDDPDALPSAHKDKHAPAVQLEALPGKTLFTNEDLQDGTVKLVNFWASWCAPCRVEHPNLEALAADGIRIFGVNYKDKTDNAMGFLEELGDPYEKLGADESGRMALDWGLYGVPETYVIDGEGRVVLRFAGPITQRVLAGQIEPAIQEALANSNQ